MNHTLEQFLIHTPYVNGVGHRYPSLTETYANLRLVDDEVRLSFMLQGIDFKDKALVAKVLTLILEAGYVLVPSHQGIVVCLPDNARKVKRLINLHERTNDPEPLGRALSYPAAHDFPSPFVKGRKAMNWWVRWRRGRTEYQLMANVFLDEDLVAEGEALADRMAESLEPFGLVVRFDVRRNLRPAPAKYKKIWGL